MRRALLALLSLASLAFPAQVHAIVHGGGPSAVYAAPAACMVANYAALPSSAADGTLCETIDTKRWWLYDTATTLWLPPDANPAALLESYTGAALPSDSGWLAQVSGTDTAAVAAGILTLTDTAAGTQCHCWRDAANFNVNNNMGVAFRMRVTAQSADNDGGKEWMGITTSAAEGQMGVHMARGAAVGIHQITPGTNGTENVALATKSGINNGSWGIYLLVYRVENAQTSFYLLDGKEALFSLDRSSFGAGTAATAPCNTDSSFVISMHDAGESVTTEIDWIRIFNF